MPEFQFRAIDHKGKLVSSASNAPTREDLADILHDQGLFLMEAREVLASRTAAGDAASPAKMQALARLRRAWLLRRDVNLKDVAFFTAQLALMMRTALPLLESMDILSNQAANPVFREILLDVANRVSEGEPLSIACARHPRAFDSVYTSLLAAGEASGEMVAMLDRLTAYLDFKVRLRQNLRSALVYPVAVLLTALAVVAFLIIFVLPTFTEIFAQLNIELPLPTRILIASGTAARRWWYLLLAGGAAAVWLFRKWAARPDHARRLDRLRLRLPIVGELTRNIVLTRVLRTMASLLESGVNILRSLDLAKAAAGNFVFSDLLESVTQDVREGKPLSKSLMRSPFVPAAVIGMIATGEQTGTLPQVINRVAGFFEDETNTAIKNLFSALEPLFILGLGFMVGGIAVSVLLPLLNVAQAIE